MKKLILTVVALGAVFALPAQTSKATDAADNKTKPTWVTVDSWPIEGCIVSGQALKEGKAKTFEVDGNTYKTCCGKCKSKVEKDPAKYAKKLQAAVVAAQTDSYPLTTCVLTDKKLNDKAKNVVVDGTLVRLCCGRCVKKSQTMGKKLAGTVQAARFAKQAKAYALEVCVVSGEKIDAKDATNVMYGGTLVRLCCKDCIADFKKTPGVFAAKLTKAGEHGDRKGEHGDRKGEHKGGDGEATPSSGECCASGAKAGESCCAAKSSAKSCCEEGSAKKPAKTKAKSH